jgi:hypothetical protein
LHSIFNRLDAIIFCLGITGFVLRFFPDQFVVAKSVYAVNGGFLFIRILGEYSANSRLGPKLVMILTMVSRGETAGQVYVHCLQKLIFGGHVGSNY